ncbi:hypothetical protein HF086_003278 [Spodoptera exigua]|uniref:Uncharacterized protein n=1 Tax=Spodoptera exigua TaxID=7107 RepID=A0A922MGI1_SPOEX|nr:hypothetical protein HF086_003278 [Spodoptera exigua]
MSASSSEVKVERHDLYQLTSSASVGSAPGADIKPNFGINVLDFRAGCNPYWGHPEQEFRALRCDRILRRCVPVTVPPLPKETLNIRRSFRYEVATSRDCPMSCRGYECKGGLVPEHSCVLGGFLPDKEQCNCCGRCSMYQQLNEKCAEFKKTFQNVNGTVEIEVEEEFLEPGCDDGLVCRQGRYCARERCRTGSDVECDGYGNYKEAVFSPHIEEWKLPNEKDEDPVTSVSVAPEDPRSTLLLDLTSMVQ